MELARNTYPPGEDFFDYVVRNTKYRDDQYHAAVKWAKKFQKDEPLCITDITEDWGIGFKRFLFLNGLSHNTVSLYFHKIKTLLNKAVRDCTIPFNPLKALSVPVRRQPPEQLSDCDINRFYEKLDTYSGVTREVLRVFLLGLETGLRVSDIINLKESNIKDGHIKLYQQKNNKWVDNLLTNRAKDLLKEGLPKPRIAKKAIYNHINIIFRDIGIECKSKFHLARHTFANTHVEIGTPLPVLQQLMGHSNIGSTMHYVNPTQSAKDEAMKRFGGR